MRAPYAPPPSDTERRARCYCDFPGWFAVRQVRRGPEVALQVQHQPTPDPTTGEINWERPHIWTYTLGGKIVHEDMARCPRIWIGREIDQAEYDFLLADRHWAAENAPHTPEAQPDQAGDLRKMEPVF